MILTCFLGTGNYASCRQFHQDQPNAYCDTPYIQTALAQLATEQGTPITEIRILGTDQSWEKHGDSLSQDLCSRGLPKPIRYAIPDGSAEREFWAIFGTLRSALQGETVILDITHGFRAQPFFAAAVVQYMAALGELPAQLHMHYGQLSDDRSECQIWDLSAFINLMQWSSALDGFIAFGKGAKLNHLAQAQERSVRAKLAKTREQHLIQAGPLLKSLNQLCDALDTVRVPHIVSDAPYDNHNKRTATNHAQDVRQQIAASRPSVEEHIPPLSPLLDKLDQLLAPLSNGHTDNKRPSLQAQKALAQQYLTWQRPAEASIVLREAHISRHTKIDEPALARQTRENAEDRWFDKDTHNCQDIGEVRNDIQHGGWRDTARQALSLKKELGKLVEELPTCAADFPNAQLSKLKTVLVSRHPAAVTWLQTQGYTDAQRVEHLDHGTLSSLNAGDTVVGTLPIHLAAKLNEKAVHFEFLVLDIPTELRGQELDGAMFLQCNPHLQRFTVKALD